MEFPPPIPYRSRQHSRRKSLSGPSAHSSNRVSIQPASPEVISSLITSLSIISSPAKDLFENHHSIPVSPAASTVSFTHPELRPTYNRISPGGSFGIDYGAFRQPSIRELVEEESLDELAASPPVIKTAKPPSGFSALTAPKPPAPDSRSNSLKSFLRRPGSTSSKGSQGSKERDDASTIGSLSIEPSYASTPSLRKKRSMDSWDKKQGRNHKGLLYMSSKERLRDNASDKKRAGSGNLNGLGLDRLAMPGSDQPTFMAETPITEEPPALGDHTMFTVDTTNTTPISCRWSPSMAISPGGIGSGRFIPPRDSSLRKPEAQTIKRDSKLASRQSDMERERGKEKISERDEAYDQKRESSTESGESTNLNVPTEGYERPVHAISTDLASNQGETISNYENVVVDDEVDCAPAPVITQRRPQLNTSSSKSKRSSGISPEPSELKSKRSSTRLKRLSGPLSAPNSDNDVSKRNFSRPTSRVVSSEQSRPSSVSIDARPSSADSIDDAVTAYLASPRLSQKIRHPQSGRTISFSEVGDPEGSAVFCCVGMGLTRYLTAFYDELALALKLRLITPDRPGVGQSEPYTDGTATPLSWPGKFQCAFLICPKLT